MAKHLKLGIRGWLIVLSVFSALPVGCFSLFTLYGLNHSQSEARTAELAHHAAAAAAAVEQHLGAMIATAMALAQSDAALHQDVPSLLGQSLRLAERLPQPVAIILIDRAGRQIFNTDKPADNALPSTGLPETLRQVFKSGQPTISDLFRENVDTTPNIAVDVPVFIEEEVAYCLRLVVPAHSFDDVLKHLDSPPNWTVVLLSQSGVIVGRNRLGDKFIGTRSAPEIVRAAADNQSGVIDSVTYEGSAVKAAVARVAPGGWAVAVGVPTDLLTSDIRRSVWLLALGGLVSLMAGFVAAFLLARRLAWQVSAVSAASIAFGEGEAPHLPQSSVRELDAMGAALESVHWREGQVAAALAKSRAMETRLRSSETKLAKEASRFQALLKTATDGIHVIDANGDLQEASDSFLRQLGRTADEARGLNVADWDACLPEDDLIAFTQSLVNSETVLLFETRIRRSDGTLLDVEISSRGVTLDDQRYAYCSARDITERKRAEASIERLAFYDTLTRLPNRRLLQERLLKAKALGARQGTHCALIFIDVDNFKILNDTQGHRFGDLLLQEVARRLEACAPRGQTVARLGGDEFVVMLENLGPSLEEATLVTEDIAGKILKRLAQPFSLEGFLHHSSVSLGITLFCDKDVPNDDLLKQADLAMYQAKAAGRNTRRFFNPEMQTALNAQSSLENDLRRAISTPGELVLFYQPQVDGQGSLVGAEALIRWLHPTRGMVMPAEFIPVAESSDLILSIGSLVLKRACAQLTAWQAFDETRHLTVAVNVSVRQFRHPDFVRLVTEVIDQSGADPHKLKLELTESLLLVDLDDGIAKMEKLARLGVHLSLDDFGTGYSSLSYLKRLPLAEIKIDRSFVRDILTDSNDAAIARAIVLLGKSLGLGVIAEGVEEMGQWNFLQDEGCDRAQGYLFGRPMAVDAFREFANHRVR